MKLVGLVNIFLKVSEELSLIFPSKKKQFNNLFLNLSELTQYLIFDKDKDRDFFYPGTTLSPKNLYSVLKIHKEIEKSLADPNKINKEKIFELLIDLDTKLKSLQWYLEDARKNIDNVLIEIEKKIEDEETS